MGTEFPFTVFRVYNCLLLRNNVQVAGHILLLAVILWTWATLVWSAV